jgi:single-strand DNA-binding protein
MASLNKVILMGNLTRDVELRFTPSNTAVADIGLAVNERRKDASGAYIEDTTFVEVTLWGRTAEVAAEYLNKGSPVLIEGRLKLDTWESEGTKRSKMKVVCNQMQLIGSGKGKGGKADSAADDTGTPTDGEVPVGAGDDIPF